MAKTREHYFHAEAEVLTANFQVPLQRNVKKHVSVFLPPGGGYRTKQAEDFRLKGVLSYEFAYTQVAGNRSPKDKRGFVTLATSVIERLNVLDVVTADRVVAQISTEHPLQGTVPSITFLGTRFENLKIGKHKIEPELNMVLCGRPAGDKLYIAEGTDFMTGVATQYARLKERNNLPDSLRKKYHEDLLIAEKIKAQGKKAKVECSLVDHIDDPAPGTTTFGHVIDVPDFGKVSLGELTVNHNSFLLTMIHLELGCLADASALFSTIQVNGGGKPLPPPPPKP